jgi:hypothetical protein
LVFYCFFYKLFILLLELKFFSSFSKIYLINYIYNFTEKVVPSFINFRQNSSSTLIPHTPPSNFYLYLIIIKEISATYSSYLKKIDDFTAIYFSDSKINTILLKLSLISIKFPTKSPEKVLFQPILDTKSFLKYATTFSLIKLSEHQENRSMLK